MPRVAKVTNNIAWGALSGAKGTLGQVEKDFATLKASNRSGILFVPVRDTIIVRAIPGVPASPSPQALIYVAVGDKEK